MDAKWYAKGAVGSWNFITDYGTSEDDETVLGLEEAKSGNDTESV